MCKLHSAGINILHSFGPDDADREEGFFLFGNDDNKHRINQVYRNGIDLYLEGVRTSPDKLSRCINEDGVYMADYVWDERGNLLEVRYDKIKNGKS